MQTTATPPRGVTVGPLPTAETPAARESPPLDEPWWPLSARQCQCLAARQASLANLMDQERRLLDSLEGDSSCDFEAVQQLRRELLLHQAVQERNNNAERALLAYYGLVEILLQEEILEKSRGQIDELNQAVELVLETEVAVELDATEGLRRLSDALAEGSRLNLLRREVNQQLRSLLGVRDEQPGQIWPTCHLAPADPIEPLEQAEQRALQCRSDLLAVRTLRRRLDASTLAAARSALSAFQAGLGADLQSALTCTPSCLTQWLQQDDCDDQRELAARCAQLAELEEYLERLVLQQVRKQHAAHRDAVRRLLLAQQKVDAWKTRQTQLQTQQQAGGSLGAELKQAALMQLAAESEVATRLLAVEIVKMRLKAAQGLLAAECGWGPCGASHAAADPLAETPAPPAATAEAVGDPPRRGPEFPDLHLPDPPEFAEFLDAGRRR